MLSGHRIRQGDKSTALGDPEKRIIREPRYGSQHEFKGPKLTKSGPTQSRNTNGSSIFPVLQGL